LFGANRIIIFKDTSVLGSDSII